MENLSPADSGSPEVRILADRSAVSQAVAQELLNVLRETIAAEGVAHISLTGGGAGTAALTALAELKDTGEAAGVDWSRVHFWWGDERLLPERDAERNAVQAWDALLGPLVADGAVPAEHIHPMPTSEQAADPGTGAKIYAQELESYAVKGGVPGPHGPLNLPTFAVMLLGVGPDGHINSLFPGKAALSVTGRTTTGEQDSPKPPPLRVTLTFDAVQTARRVWLVTTGEDKAEAVAGALSAGAKEEEYPAAGAYGTEQTVWFVDEAAAGRVAGP